MFRPIERLAAEIRKQNEVYREHWQALSETSNSTSALVEELLHTKGKSVDDAKVFAEMTRTGLKAATAFAESGNQLEAWNNIKVATRLAEACIETLEQMADHPSANGSLPPAEAAEIDRAIGDAA